MAYLKINGVNLSPFVSGLKVGFETLVSDSSGRNAAGDTVIDIINRKEKVYVTFRHTTQEEMETILGAVADYVVDTTFLNPKTNSMKEIKTYISTPEPEYYTIQDGFIIYKPMTLNFIEL